MTNHLAKDCRASEEKIEKYKQSNINKAVKKEGMYHLDTDQNLKIPASNDIMTEAAGRPAMNYLRSFERIGRTES